MGFLFRHKKAINHEADYHEIVQRAKMGDDDARNTLIRMYTPFILKVAAKVSGRYIRVGEDDEVSIGMIAFNEAINSFDKEKNIAFLTFAETVMKRRLIDYYRKEKKNKNYIPFSSFDTDENNQNSSINYIEAKKSINKYQILNDTNARKEEILQYSKLLKEYDLDFSELVRISPKHEDARLRAMEVARLIVEDGTLVEHVTTKKELPLKQIVERVAISRKTLERQRKYIIAMILILNSNFEYLKDYIIKSR